jgi:hypothetical protein
MQENVLDPCTLYTPILPLDFFSCALRKGNGMRVRDSGYSDLNDID